MTDYAYLNEIWIDPIKVGGPTPPQCSLVNNDQLDNIMDAYISEEHNVPQETLTPHVKKCIDVNTIQGYEDNSALLKYAYTLDSYYDNDIKTIKSLDSKEEVVPCKTEEIQETRKIPIYRDMVESFSNTPDKTSYIELVIYILSGIFLIFIMEQILQIGKYIKIK